MTILKWLFHKDINPEILKREIRELHDLFKEYIVFFKEKESATNEAYYHFKLPGLKSEIQRFNKALLEGLGKEENEQKLIRIITSSNVLTGKEEHAIVIIKQKLRVLKMVLRKQVTLYDELSKQIDDYENAYEKIPGWLYSNVELTSMRIKVQNLSELVKMESKLLFGERQAVYELQDYIVKDMEFPVVRNVECPATRTVLQAQRNLSLFKDGRLEVAYLYYIPASIACKPHKLVFYVGSLEDPIAIFCFPNSEIYILQDPQDSLRYLYNHLKILNRTNVIHNLRKKGNEFTFTFNEQLKLLKAYYGNKGYSDKYVPPEVRQFGADVVMTKSLTISQEEKAAILKNIFPHIKKRGFVHHGLLRHGENEGFVKVHREWHQKL